jgi:hypothetical protein
MSNGMAICDSDGIWAVVKFPNVNGLEMLRMQAKVDTKITNLHIFDF